MPAQPPTGAPGTPDAGFAGALMTLIHSLAQNFAPKAVTQIKQRNDQAEAMQLHGFNDDPG